MATADVLKPDFASQRKHFIFTDEHEALRESIHRFVVKELAPHADEWEETTFPDSVFARMGELGFLGLDKPEAYGGQGGDYYSALVLAEEMAHANCGGLAMGVAVQTDMAMPPILAFGTEEQKQEWAAPAIAGKAILCIGITEPYDGFTLFLVPMDTPGVIREKRLQKLGMHASDTALLAFNDVRVPSSAVLGQIGKGFYHIMWELQGERLIGAAGCVAGAQSAFDRTLQYAKERNAFGRPIGRFQVIRHKFADMATKIETARQMVYTTAWRFANGEYPVREITMAKLYSARIAVEVADECIQIHGGAGYMKEYGIERAWRDLRLNRIGAGTDEIMLDVIGRSYGL
jgi:alkylation response protein AidB-like acyl-CoA dehydrogenase